MDQRLEKGQGRYSLLIGIPTYGMPRCEFTIDSLASLTYHIGRRHPEIEQLWVQRDVRTYRQAGRQAIVETSLQRGCTHTIMLDDDHYFAPEDFDKMWEAMITRDDVWMIAGLYMTRGLPPVPCIFKLTDQGTVPIFYYPDNELFAVDVVGFGFTLFDNRVFLRVNSPWFNLGTGFGEDAAFCDRVRMAGLKVWVHTGAKIGHLMEQPHVITEADFLRARDTIWRDLGPSQLVPAGRIQLPDGQSLGVTRGWRHSASRLWHVFSGGNGRHPAPDAAPVESGGDSSAGGSEGRETVREGAGGS